MSVFKRWNGEAWETIGPGIKNTASVIPNDSEAPGAYVGDALSNLKNNLDILNEGGLILEEDFIESQVDEWLDQHPEATTTVEDKSLTWEKFVNGAMGYVRPEDFGAVGDYVTDDSEAFQQAFSSGFPVYIDGTYVVNNVICNNNLTAFFSQKTRIKRTQTKSGNQSGIFEFRGTITNTTSLTTDCDEESTQITVEDSSNFNIGDMVVLLNQNDTYSGNFILTTMITAINGNQIFLKDKAQHSFLLSENPIIQQIEPITVNLYGEGATFDGNGLVGRGYCIFMKYNLNSSINNFNVINNSTGISRLDECYNCYISECNGENPTSIEPPYGEFLSIAYSTHIIADKINTTSYRRVVDYIGAVYCDCFNSYGFNGGFTAHGLCSKYCNFIHCMSYENNNNDYRNTVGNGTYYYDRDITFKDCYIIGGNQGILCVSKPNEEENHWSSVNVINCTFLNQINSISLNKNCQCFCDGSTFNITRSAIVCAEYAQAILKNCNVYNTASGAYNAITGSSSSKIQVYNSIFNCSSMICRDIPIEIYNCDISTPKITNSIRLGSNSILSNCLIRRRVSILADATNILVTNSQMTAITAVDPTTNDHITINNCLTFHNDNTNLVTDQTKYNSINTTRVYFDLTKL